MSLKSRLFSLSQATEGMSKEELVLDWTDALDKLYRRFEEFLEPLVNDKLISIARFAVNLTEESLGLYTTSELKLSSGPKTVSLTPIARMVVDATGRVDVSQSGSRKSVRLLRRGISSESRWEYALTPSVNPLMPAIFPLDYDRESGLPKNLQFVELTDDAIERMLEYSFSA